MEVLIALLISLGVISADASDSYSDDQIKDLYQQQLEKSSSDDHATGSILIWDQEHGD